MGLITSKNLLIIDGSDYLNDNYHLEKGQFALDLVAVSSVTPAAALQAGSFLYGPYYTGVSSGYYLKWEFPANYVSYAIVKGSTYENGCVLYPSGSAAQPRTSFYAATSNKLSSVYTVIPSNQTARLITNIRKIGSVSPCLVVPASADEDTNGNLTVSRTFLDYTLSGGIEAIRFYVNNFPKFQVSAYVLDQTLTVIGSAIWEQEFYELSADIINTNNIVDNWYFDVTGFMYPSSALPSNWKVKWNIEKISNNIGLSSDNIGLVSATYLANSNEYEINKITLSGKSYTIVDNPYINNIRFNFNEPGYKNINFAVISSITVYNNYSNSNIASGDSATLKTVPVKINDLISTNIKRLDDSLYSEITSSPSNFFISWYVSSLSFVNALTSIQSVNYPTLSTNFSNDSSRIKISNSFPITQFSSVNLNFSATNIKYQVLPNVQTQNFDEILLARHELTSVYFNSLDLGLIQTYYGEGDVGNIKVVLSAVTYYQNKTKLANIDETHPSLKFYYEGGGSLYAKNFKTGNIINNDDYIYGDTISLEFLDPATYYVSVYFDDNSGSASYIFDNLRVDNINILSSYNSCSLIPYVELSAVSRYNNSDILIKNTNAIGNTIKLKWNTDSEYAKIYNKSNILLESGESYNCIDSNPVRVYFDYPRSINTLTNTTNISVSCDSVLYSDDTDSISINSKTTPAGADIDFKLNYELASELSEGFYRFINTNKYNLNLLGLLKRSDYLGWYTNNEFLNLTDANNKAYYYFNDDDDNKIFGVNLVTSLNINSNYLLSSVTFGISCLQLVGYDKQLSLEKTIDLKIFKLSALPTLSAFLYPEYVFNPTSLTNPICSLAFDPNAYFTYKPYPSAYGEGKTVTFLGSANGIDNSIKYNEFIWDITDANSTVKSLNNNLNIKIPTFSNATNSLTASVGGFNSSIGLKNQFTKYYKSDEDGSVKMFPNWKVLSSTPIKITTYNLPSSQSLILNKTTSNNALNVDLQIDLQFPISSPVTLNKNNMLVYWNVSTDDGATYSKLITGNNVFRAKFDSNSFATTMYINASAKTPLYIANSQSFSPNYPDKPIYVNIPSVNTVTSIDVNYFNFKVVSNSANTVFYNFTNTITALRSAKVSGVIQTSLPYTNYTWTVSNNVYTNTNWISSFNTNPPSPYKVNDYTDIKIPITLTINSNGTPYTKTNYLLVKAPPKPNIEFYPDNVISKVNESINFYTNIEGLIPISSVYYRFEDESTIYSLTANNNFTHTFTSVGDINIYVSAIDIKGFLHEQTIENVISVIENWDTYNKFIKQDSQTSLSLPYNFTDIKVAPNEWVLANTINNSLQNMYYNTIYLDIISNFYTSAPYRYLGWYGNTANGHKWYLYPYNENYSQVNPSTDVTPLNDIIAYSESSNFKCIAYKNKIELRSITLQNKLISEVTKRGVDDEFINIVNVFIDNEDKVIVLDKISENRCIISVFIYDPLYTFNPFRLLTKWGGLGDADSKLKFRNVNDMSLDYENNIVVADTGNRAIKRYTTTGSWISTIKSDKFNITESMGTLENGSVISAFYANNKYTYSLTKDEVIVFDENGSFLTSFNWRQNLENQSVTPIRIIAAYDNNILYVLCEEYLIKYTIDGLFLGIVGETPEEFSTNVTDFKYVNATHNKNRVLTLVADKFILKYSDFVNYLKVKPLVNSVWWCMGDIKIKDEEFVEYWVYNRAFARLWDNLEYFRTTLFGRIIRVLDINGKSVVKYYNRLNYARPEFTYKKEDIFIGMNEIVSAEVVNRCLERLYYNSIELLNMLISQETIWRWSDTIQTGTNPVTYTDTKKNYTKQTRWFEGAG